MNYTILDPSTVFIGKDVKIGAGAVIYPMNSLSGNTVIGAGATLFSFNDLHDVVVGDGSLVRSTYAIGAEVGKNCTVGPFATLRAGTKIGDNCRVGNYVEIKNSLLEDGVKAAHLAYVGDSEVGEGTNIGCGVIFANYDGKRKNRVKVGKKVFIGCNSNLVAPLEIEEGAYIAAGSTVTQHVPQDCMCIARARQVNKTDWKNAVVYCK
jgi:bifunctional UDP-N-acetylglucosamine pyrophosphorylase/glucosamine-1-phosphate N-acetyltransferase